MFWRRQHQILEALLLPRTAPERLIDFVALQHAFEVAEAIDWKRHLGRP